MIPYGRQTITEEDIGAVVEVLRSDWLTQGPKVEEFEKALSIYCGAKHGVVFSSGTAALHAAYFAGGLKAGDECIVSPMTFAATANALLWLGARPIFADIDIETGNLDPADVKNKLTPGTRAIAAVDFAGHAADYDALQKIASDRNIMLIDDACHALGGSYKSRKIGSICDMTVFSFHPVKSITCGEGGAVMTNDKKFYERLQLFRSHGIVKEREKFVIKSEGEWYYEMQELGLNYRLTDIQAALGISQLKKLDKFVAKRKVIVERYLNKLSDVNEIELPKEKDGIYSSWHLYAIRLRPEFAQKRGEIFRRLREAGIGVQVHYLPVYLHPYYQRLGYKAGLCPNAEAFYRSEISLPIYPTLTESQQDFVIDIFKKVVQSVCEHLR